MVSIKEEDFPIQGGTIRVKPARWLWRATMEMTTKKRTLLFVGLLPVLLLAIFPLNRELSLDQTPPPPFSTHSGSTSPAASVTQEVRPSSSFSPPTASDTSGVAPATASETSGVAPFAEAEQASTGMEVTYGSVLKLIHGTTDTRLHATNVLYNSKAEYHLVTGFNGVNSGSYWSVKPAAESSAQPGDTIPNGSSIKLQNVQMQEWLHCRPNASPLSRNLEVSCLARQNGEDHEDLWMLEFVDKGKVWTRDQKIRLKHTKTGSFLHSHQMMYNQRVVRGQTEVCGVMEETKNSIWIAAEGVYLPSNKETL